MKINCLKVGGRTIKTVVAVFLCLLTGTIRKSDTAFYAAIAAVLCVQRTSKDSFREAFNREMATVIGGMCVVFLCITVTHGNDESPLSFGAGRILDTTIGIVIALIINQFPVQRILTKGERAGR